VIVRRLDEIRDTERHVHAPTWESCRFLLEKDGMGFSMHETIIHAGTETTMWYRHHLEAVYCIEGEGEIEVLGGGPVHRIGPGTLYALDGHERHCLRARSRLRMVCVFNPPCTGREVHDADGAYPASGSGEGSS
jgi:L-ectoine synthase